MRAPTGFCNDEMMIRLYLGCNYCLCRFDKLAFWRLLAVLGRAMRAPTGCCSDEMIFLGLLTLDDYGNCD